MLPASWRVSEAGEMFVPPLAVGSVWASVPLPYSDMRLLLRRRTGIPMPFKYRGQGLESYTSYMRIHPERGTSRNDRRLVVLVVPGASRSMVTRVCTLNWFLGNMLKGS